jgi:cytosine/adenosine deaminase-related metal-dependent hydrolase
VEAAAEIDAAGRLVKPAFCDPHFHMDATLSLGLPRMNRSGTLLEGIALWGELRPTLTREALVERALRYCDLAVSQGLLVIRSHVDVCDDRLSEVPRRGLRPGEDTDPAGRLPVHDDLGLAHAHAAREARVLDDEVVALPAAVDAEALAEPGRETLDARARLRLAEIVAALDVDAAHRATRPVASRSMARWPMSRRHCMPGHEIASTSA